MKPVIPGPDSYHAAGYLPRCPPRFARAKKCWPTGFASIVTVQPSCGASVRVRRTTVADELLRFQSDSNTTTNYEGFRRHFRLLHASADDLKRVKGLGPAKRAELLAVLELARRAMAPTNARAHGPGRPGCGQALCAVAPGRANPRGVCRTVSGCAEPFAGAGEPFRGTLTQTSVYPSQRLALHHQASAVVLAHNHPSGTDAAQPRRRGVDADTQGCALALLGCARARSIIVAPGQAPRWLNDTYRPAIGARQHRAAPRWSGSVPDRI